MQEKAQKKETREGEDPGRRAKRVKTQERDPRRRDKRGEDPRRRSKRKKTQEEDEEEKEEEERERERLTGEEDEIVDVETFAGIGDGEVGKVEGGRGKVVKGLVDVGDGSISPPCRHSPRWASLFQRVRPLVIMIISLSLSPSLHYLYISLLNFFYQSLCFSIIYLYLVATGKIVQISVSLSSFKV